MTWDDKMQLQEERSLAKQGSGSHTPSDTAGAFEEENPRALINIVPDGMADLIRKLKPSFLKMSEKELYEQCEAGPIINRIRLAFWKEYDLAQGEVRPMTWLAIARMVQRPTPMIRMVMEDPKRLAWILCPPANYDVFLEEALSHGMTRIREILDLPIRNESGRIDTKVAELILKSAAFLDLRRHGGFVQKQVTVDVGMTERQMKNFSSQVNVEDISKRIKELEQELGKGPQQDVIDVTGK